MSNSSYIIRNYRPGDFSNYARLKAEAEKLESTRRGTSLQALSESLGRPNYSPGDDLFIAEINGNIVGYADVSPELKIRRVILSCFIHPEHRRRGLATKLFSYVRQRARELGVEVAHVNITQDNAAGKSLLSKLDFRFVRRFLELRLKLSKVYLPDVNHSAPLCRHLQRGEEDILTQIQNRSFAGTWGYNPNTVEEIIYHINVTNCSPGDIILVYEGDRPIGYCWTRINIEEGADRGESKGYILMLGVSPDHRGQGIGKKVLLAGLSYLKGRGIQVVELTVDSENRAACALYRSAGFKIWSTTLWYEKVLD